MAGRSRTVAENVRHLAAATLLVVGCDNFDFGRVTGHPQAARSAVPKTSTVASAAPTSVSSERLEGNADDHVVLLGGDIALGNGTKTRVTTDKTYDLLAGLRPVLIGADFVLASLVSPFTDSSSLARSGLRVVDVTSDRLWSSGKHGLTGTLSDLIHDGVLPAGASADSSKAWEPARLTLNGTTIAVVATAIGPASAASLGIAREHVAFYASTRLAASVRDAKRDGAFVIVSAGGAPEYDESASPDQIALGRAAIEAGADVVLAHGAHVPLGVSFTRGRPIFYGLGNLLGDGDLKRPWSARGFVARITLRKQITGAIDLCPYLVVNGEPQLLAGTSRTTEEGIFARALGRLSAPLGALSIGEPDLHSCLRIAPAEGASP